MATSAILHGRWRVRIGLEIHAQVLLKTKLFSRAPTAHALPNVNVSLFDASYPGTLPQLNRVAVEQAVRAGIALNCEINKLSQFERKHYFYQDLPLGYQITQQRHPIAHSGSLTFTYDVDNSNPPTLDSKTVSIERIQIEQDSGKSLHDLHDSMSLVDLNRAGMTLIEIVFAPELNSPEQAVGVLKTMRSLLRHINICDGNLEDGSMRCDVNVSVEDTQKPGHKPARVEVKNLNTMQRTFDASTFEINRHINLMENGGKVSQETRGYDAFSRETFVMRAKESAMDYRYFPDPDLPVLEIDESTIDRIRLTLPELPHQTTKRLLDIGLTSYQVGVLMSTQGTSYFESVLALVKNTRKGSEDLSGIVLSVYNWVATELLGRLNVATLTFATSPLKDWQLAGIIQLVMNQKITVLNGKKLLSIIFENGESGKVSDPQELAKELGMTIIEDNSVIHALIEASLADPKNAKSLKGFLDGNVGMFNFFVGDVMKRSGRNGNPQVIRSLLEKIRDSNKS